MVVPLPSQSKAVVEPKGSTRKRSLTFSNDCDGKCVSWDASCAQVHSLVIEMTRSEMSLLELQQLLQGRIMYHKQEKVMQ